jgi:hypothetical protein
MTELLTMIVVAGNAMSAAIFFRSFTSRAVAMIPV